VWPYWWAFFHQPVPQARTEFTDLIFPEQFGKSRVSPTMVIKKQRRDAAAAGGGFKLKSKVAESLSLSGAILNDTFPRLRHALLPPVRDKNSVPCRVKFFSAPTQKHAPHTSDCPTKNSIGRP
jgi:hypothetical protein